MDAVGVEEEVIGLDLPGHDLAGNLDVARVAVDEQATAAVQQRGAVQLVRADAEFQARAWGIELLDQPGQHLGFVRLALREVRGRGRSRSSRARMCAAPVTRRAGSFVRA